MLTGKYGEMWLYHDHPASMDTMLILAKDRVEHIYSLPSNSPEALGESFGLAPRDGR
jgi:hypothetical protein